MDYPSDDGENFYTPNPPTEQVVAQEQAVAQTVAAMPILEQLIKDFEEFQDEARSIDKIVIGQGINTDAQILAKGEILAFCKEKLSLYRALYESVKPTQEGTP